MESIDYSFGSPERRCCRIRVGAGALTALEDDLVASPPGRLLVVVSDSNVAPLHGDPLAERLERRGLGVDRITFPAGEAGKTRQTKALLEDRLLELDAGRETALIAVGGGVTGDLVGFLASTWHRGVPVVQVPTSLLAMVDAAIGGKTAVNLPGAKNLVGTVHQPWGIYADPAVLATLPDNEYPDGFAEVVKSAVIADAGFFAWLESEAASLRGRNPGILEQAIVRCARIKAAVVSEDPLETGRRAILNFGHTVGHAVESVSGYDIRHGPAVAIGMCIEARLAVQATGFPAADAGRLRALLERFGLPVVLPGGLSRDEIVAATRRDKKVRGGQVRYALPAETGRMAEGAGFTVAVEESLLREALGRN